MSSLETILSAIIISLVSGLIGNLISSHKSVKKEICDECRESCQALLLEKISNLTERVEALTKAVDSRLLGII
jgi:hypothetical protein